MSTGTHHLGSYFQQLAIRQIRPDDFSVSLGASTNPHKSTSYERKKQRSSTVRHRAAKNLAAVLYCAYCSMAGTPSHGPDGKDWHMDHVFSLSRGGEDATWNIVKSCSKCNLAKGAKFWLPQPGTLNGDRLEWRDPVNHYGTSRTSMFYVPIRSIRSERDLMVSDYKPAKYDGSPGAEGLATVNYGTAQNGGLWWLSQDLGELIARAASLMPLFELHEEHIPAWPGICFLEYPLLGARPFLGSQNDYVNISAVSWTMAQSEGGHPLLYVVGHSRIREGWVPTSYAGWAIGQKQDDVSLAEKALDTNVEDLNWLAALWSIAAQQRYVTCGIDAGTRAERRRSLKASTPSDIKIVRLRSTRQSAANGDLTGSQHGNYSHRFLVAGHWKMQPFGPARQLRRPIYIDEYVKGPEGSPLVVKETVRAVTA